MGDLRYDSPTPPSTGTTGHTALPAWECGKYCAVTSQLLSGISHGWAVCEASGLSSLHAMGRTLGCSPSDIRYWSNEANVTVTSGHTTGTNVIKIKRVSVLISPRIKSPHNCLVQNNEASPQNILTGFDLPSSHVH